MSSSFGNNLIKAERATKGSKVTRPVDEEKGDLIRFVWSSGRREKTRLDRHWNSITSFFPVTSSIWRLSRKEARLSLQTSLALAITARGVMRVVFFLNPELLSALPAAGEDVMLARHHNPSFSSRTLDRTSFQSVVVQEKTSFVSPSTLSTYNSIV